MGVTDVVFTKDVVLDEEAFSKASKELSDLSVRMKGLRTIIEELLTSLKKGFDTQAGAKFFSSCEKNLLQPLSDQVLVFEHVSENLTLAKSSYKSVFSEYQKLNRIISNQ